MSRRKRRRGRQSGAGAAEAPSAAPSTSTTAAPPREKKPLVVWRDRADEVVGRLRAYAKERYGFEIEAFLREGFGDGVEQASVRDLEQAFDDFVCTSGSAGDGRSILAAWIGEDEALDLEERRQLLTWENERHRRVYLLDRGQRDHLELWDPVRGGRATVQLLDRLPKGRLAALDRGTVVIATTAPWGTRTIALGPVELYDDDEAISLYRKEVRDLGRLWHELPAPAPA